MPNRKPSPHVCVAIVTHDSRRYIRPCLEAVLRQEGVSLEVVVVDNASGDETRQELARFEGRVRTILNDRNVGFAAAQNQAIAAGGGDWVLALNPDALLGPGFIRRLVDAGGFDRQVGTVCGRLLSIGPGFEPPPDPRIDSTGIYFTPDMRHFDRGWREPDNGCYRSMEYVFGASAAAALYRREMIEDVSVNGEFFDPDFFSYREDADVAWRAQLLGWRCIYNPEATAWHVRSVTSANRRAVPAAINMHSVKNRFLLRIKNTTPGVLRRCWLPMVSRDLLVIGGCLLWEHRSLAAFWRLAKCLPRALERRRAIMSRRRVDDEAIAAWFNPRPSAQPVDSHPALAAGRE
jgi:GT2 family glycosyltransferase